MESGIVWMREGMKCMLHYIVWLVLCEFPPSSPLPLSEHLRLFEVLVPLSSFSSHLVLLSRSCLKASSNANVNVGGNHKPDKKSKSQLKGSHLGV